MSTTDNVTPMPMAWTQVRQTKLGHATISIEQVQDLYEATVSISDTSGEVFKATETFGDVKTAFLWSYGLKQALNDDFAGYKKVGNNLVESKPPKNRIADVLTVQTALIRSQLSYDNFVLGRTSTSKGDTISVSQVKSSSLSADDQATLLALMAKAKGTVKNV